MTYTQNLRVKATTKDFEEFFCPFTQRQCAEKLCRVWDDTNKQCSLKME